MRCIVLLYIVLAFTDTSTAQEKTLELRSDSLATKKVKILPVPTFGYSPETKTYLGAVALLNFDLYQNKQTRTSNASLELTYTFRKQFLLEADWNYFFDHENWFTKGRLHFSKYPDLYFSQAQSYNNREIGTRYETDRYIGDVTLYRKLYTSAFVGLNLRYISYLNFDGLADMSDVGFPDRLVRGIGIEYLLDSRDNIMTASQGMFFNFSFSYNHDNITKEYYKLILDARAYRHYWNNSVLSCRLFSHSNFRNPQPFFDEAIAGGDQFVRGYFFGKYRDQHATTFQIEWRVPLVWRVSFSAFGGISDLYNASGGFGEDYLYNIGGGLRILVDKNEGTNLRLDYAVGQYGNSGFYFAFGESF